MLLNMLIYDENVININFAYFFYIKKKKNKQNK
jgi:hypothetical protein